MTLIIDPNAVCRVCGCSAFAACIDGFGQPCSWVESDLCSACMHELPTDPMAVSDFFSWMDEHGQALEESLEELEREDPLVATAALELEQVTAELERTLPPGMRLEQVFFPSRVDVAGVDCDQGAADDAPESD